MKDWSFPTVNPEREAIMASHEEMFRELDGIPLVYLIHLEEKIGTVRRGTAGHYLGSTGDIRKRMFQHLSGCWHREGNGKVGRKGARLLNVANILGIRYRIARVWVCASLADARELEARFKRARNFSRQCIICKER